MNPGVFTHTVPSTPGSRAIRMSAGAGEPAGWCTAVLVNTMPLELGPMPSRPSERDRAAPVVRDDHDRTVEVELFGERAEIVDALL